MEYYKEVKILTIGFGETLDLSSAQYNHKALAIVNTTDTPAPGAVIRVYPNNNGTFSSFTTSGGVLKNTLNFSSYSTSWPSNFSDYFLQIRALKVDYVGSDAGTILILLLN